jgi:hypothetical protein
MFDTDILRDALLKTLSYFRREYEVTYAEAIGVLEIVKNMLIDELYEDEDEEDKDDKNAET